MRDFTLLIPTYNRPQRLRALVFYLKASAPRLKLMVLDSSDDPTGAEAVVSPAELVRYSPHTHPFDKFLDGVSRVTTPICAICADDDVMMMEGLGECIRALQADVLATVCRGRSFAFDWKPEVPDGIYLTPGLLTPPPILALTPMERLAAYLGEYHAAIYSVWRTPALKNALHQACALDSLLLRELCVGALGAIAGMFITVPKVSHGRSMGTAEIPYYEWHPLEYAVNNGPKLMAEYGRYREILADAVMARAGNRLNEVEVGRALDVIHLRYLLRHMPKPVLDFLVDRKARGDRPEGYLSPEMQDLTLRASMLPGRDMSQEEQDVLAQRLNAYMHVLAKRGQQPRVDRGLPPAHQGLEVVDQL